VIRRYSSGVSFFLYVSSVCLRQGDCICRHSELHEFARLPAPSLFTLLAIIIELGGGLLMLVGYQTRLVALGLAIYVLISAFIGHFQLGDFNQYQHFMKNMAIIGGALAFVAFGGGAYSLDASKSSKQLRVT